MLFNSRNFCSVASLHQRGLRFGEGTKDDNGTGDAFGARWLKAKRMEDNIMERIREIRK